MLTDRQRKALTELIRSMVTDEQWGMSGHASSTLGTLVLRVDPRRVAALGSDQR